MSVGTEYLSMDSLEASEKVRTIQKVLSTFQSSFQAAQRRSEGVWKLHPDAPFDRLYAFLRRCKDLLEVKMAVLQLGKLERIEVGGTQALPPSFAFKGDSPLCPLSVPAAKKIPPLTRFLSRRAYE